ncbi:hypothetical protein B1757_07705 [Acidithiobacillus marinus]|uniref:3D domain-containing protein n=1 Tax=Acidithiobacillus marinus TaxID=187490 RepID=A0A2I1DLS6_9PROT|nr:hypothetical protein [Acidithiobacillus marinus]PKY10832.1 hypothetical protein B1757_07705 [Acidithiobacillus marinus]
MIKSLSTGAGIALIALLLPNALALHPSGLPASILTQIVQKKPARTDPDPLENTGDQAYQQTATPDSPGDGALIARHQVVYLRRVTAYNALPNQTNENPDMSACGPTRPGQIALSPDLFLRRNGSNRCGEKIDIILPSGTIIHGVVWDTMSPRYHMAADILMGSVQQALDFGVRQARLRFVHAYHSAAAHGV